MQVQWYTHDPTLLEQTTFSGSRTFQKTLSLFTPFVSEGTIDQISTTLPLSSRQQRNRPLMLILSTGNEAQQPQQTVPHIFFVPNDLTHPAAAG
jgi:hypothetical protein